MKRFKKAIAPVIVAAVILGYLIWNGLNAALLLGDSLPWWWMIVFIAFLLAVLGGIVYALCQRIGEIKKEDEEDVTRKY